MVGTSSCPSGVSGKSLLAYGLGPMLTPTTITLSATGTQDLNLNLNVVLRNLVESIEARNWMVKKLNASKHIRRADHDFIEEVSDDEVEVELPDLNTYSGFIDHTQANPAEACQSIPSSTPATGANVVTSDVVSGTTNPTTNAIPPIAKASPYIDFQSLGFRSTQILYRIRVLHAEHYIS